MTSRTLLLMVAALVLAGITALLASRWLSAQRQAVQNRVVHSVAEKTQTRVLVATRDLPAGSFVKESDLRFQPWPKDGIDKSYVEEGKGKAQDFAGAVVRHGLVAGEPITSARVVMPGDRGFLAAVLTPGLRAITVSVNPTTGVAGLVFPGDHVDLVLTQSIRRGTQEPLLVSETVLENLRVLALDQRMAGKEAKEAQVVPAKNVTLEVTPKQAEIIALAADMGRLSLSLRGLGHDKDPRPTKDRHTLDRDVNPFVALASGASGRAAPGKKNHAAGGVLILRGSTGGK